MPGVGSATVSTAAPEQGDVVLTGDLPKAPTVYDPVDGSETHQARDRAERTDTHDAS